MRADRLLKTVSAQRVLLILCAATLYLSLSGFECASTEMSTAKVAIKTRDYKKAEEFLRKEVAARPQNGEAWTLLGDIYYDQNRFAEMNKAYGEAERATQPVMSAPMRENVAKRRYNGWVGISNNAYKHLSNKEYSTALMYADTAEMLRPGVAENVVIRATAYEGLNDDRNTDNAYKQYINLVRADVDDGIKIGLALNQTIDQTETLLGKSTNRTSQADLDTNLGGYAAYPAKGLYVYFGMAKHGESAKVIGWTFEKNAATPTPEFLKQAPVAIRRDGYIRLGNAASKIADTNNPSKFDEALMYFRTLEKLDVDPTLKVGAIITDLYVRSKRTDEARAALDKQLQLRPTDQGLYMSYGDVLFQMHDYAGAAEKFKKALEYAGTNKEAKELALFNLAAAYKNIGAAKQDSIRVIVEKTKKPPTKEQNDAFMNPLRESMRYFDELRASNLPNVDFAVLAELGNLYDVLGDKAKLKQIVADLEKIPSDKRDKAYWGAMSHMYAIIGDVKKQAEAERLSH